MVELAGLHVKITGDSTSLVTASGQALAGFAKLGFSAKKLETRAAASSDASVRQAAAFRRVATASKIASGASDNFNAALKKVAAASQTSTASQTSLRNALNMTKGSFAVAGAQMTTFNTKIRTSRFHTANLSAQFNDIGVMLSSGQSPFTLAIQQGTQITQVLQTMGGTAKEQMGELKKAFKAIISPTALVVIALIAGGVALARWAFKALGATTETDQLTNAIEVLEGISSSATSSLDTLTLDTKELAEKFGDAGLKARQLARDIALLTQAELRQAMMKSFTLLGDEIDGFLFNKLSLSLQKSISKSAKSLNTDPLREAFVSKVTPIFESLASNTLTFVEQEAAVGSLIETYTRFGVSMENGLLEEFDRWVGKHDWANRSEAIRDLVRDRLVAEEWAAGDLPVVASLTFVYDHHVLDLQERLTRKQHKRDGLVLSAMHVHLDHDNCMEVLVMRGAARDIEALADWILGTRGVKHGRLVRSSAGDRL